MQLDVGGGFQLLFVDVSATVAGVAACTVVAVVVAGVAMVAVVVAVVAEVVAVVAAVSTDDRLAAVTLEADEPVEVPAAMQPVITAAVANPAAPVSRRALRAGWGRRLRAGRLTVAA